MLLGAGIPLVVLSYHWWFAEFTIQILKMSYDIKKTSRNLPKFYSLKISADLRYPYSMNVWWRKLLANDKIIVTKFLAAVHHNFVILPEGYNELKHTFIGYTGIKAHFSCRLH